MSSWLARNHELRSPICVFLWVGLSPSQAWNYPKKFWGIPLIGKTPLHAWTQPQARVIPGNSEWPLAPPLDLLGNRITGDSLSPLVSPREGGIAQRLKRRDLGTEVIVDLQGFVYINVIYIHRWDNTCVHLWKQLLLTEKLRKRGRCLDL